MLLILLVTGVTCGAGVEAFPQLEAGKITSITVAEDVGSGAFTVEDPAEIAAFCNAVNALWCTEIQPYHVMGRSTSVYMSTGRGFHHLTLQYADGHTLTVAIGGGCYLRVDTGLLSSRYYFYVGEAAAEEMVEQWENLWG